MGRQAFLFELDGRRVIGFDTGLDARAFARAKLAQFITEQGLIVRPADAENPRDSVEYWKASGVIEYPGAEASAATMVIWGPAFEGERLDLIVNDGGRRDEALSVVALWLRAVQALDEGHLASAPLWPCAAIVARGRAGEPDRAFFVPPSLARRFLTAGDESLRLGGHEWYVHPDAGAAERRAAAQPGPGARLGKNALAGPEASRPNDGLAAAGRCAAFTAAAMMYRIIAGVPPFTASDDITLHQNMREGIFVPIRFAAPGLDGRLAGLIQRSLEPQGKGSEAAGAAPEKPQPRDLLAAIHPLPLGEGGADGLAVPVSSLISPLSEAQRQSLEKEKNQFIKAAAVSTNARRFITRNARILLAGFVALAAVVFFASSVISARIDRPTTDGMEPVEVIKAFYNAFGELDHMMMESAVLRGVARSDISMVMNVFVISRVRMAHEWEADSGMISAVQWREMGGGPTEASVFGITDLQIEQMEGRREPDYPQRRQRRNRDEEEMHFRANYLFWVPAQMVGAAPEEPGEAAMPVYFRHADFLTLVYRQGNWRISDLTRIVQD